MTHTDGGNHSGNIHTHIVINSVRKYSVERQPYMDKPHEEMAGYKHRSTKQFLKHLKKEVMEMCQRESLHQIDLLAPAKEKTTEKDYRKDPLAIFHYRSSLRLVVNLQENVKAMQSEAYARKVKISNLQQMAETLIYVQEHGYGHREEVTAALERFRKYSS